MALNPMAFKKCQRLRTKMMIKFFNLIARTIVTIITMVGIFLIAIAIFILLLPDLFVSKRRLKSTVYKDKPLSEDVVFPIH